MSRPLSAHGLALSSYPAPLSADAPPLQLIPCQPSGRAPTTPHPLRHRPRPPGTLAPSLSTRARRHGPAASSGLAPRLSTPPTRAGDTRHHPRLSDFPTAPSVKYDKNKPVSRYTDIITTVSCPKERYRARRASFVERPCHWTIPSRGHPDTDRRRRATRRGGCASHRQPAGNPLRGSGPTGVSHRWLGKELGHRDETGLQEG